MTRKTIFCFYYVKRLVLLLLSNSLTSGAHLCWCFATGLCFFYRLLLQIRYPSNHSQDAWNPSCKRLKTAACIDVTLHNRVVVFVFMAKWSKTNFRSATLFLVADEGAFSADDTKRSANQEFLSHGMTREKYIPPCFQKTVTQADYIQTGAEEVKKIHEILKPTCRSWRTYHLSYFGT